MSVVVWVVVAVLVTDVVLEEEEDVDVVDVDVVELDELVVDVLVVLDVVVLVDVDVLVVVVVVVELDVVVVDDVVVDVVVVEVSVVVGVVVRVVLRVVDGDVVGDDVGVVDPHTMSLAFTLLANIPQPAVLMCSAEEDADDTSDRVALLICVPLPNAHRDVLGSCRPSSSCSSATAFPASFRAWPSLSSTMRVRLSR